MAPIAFSNYRFKFYGPLRRILSNVGLERTLLQKSDRFLNPAIPDPQFRNWGLAAL
jgi:hypothetical protein